jgi:prepilin-type N-terminal cleavage/methylation domain-containing protein
MKPGARQIGSRRRASSSRRRSRRAFTLFEMLVVVALMGFIAILTPRLFKDFDQIVGVNREITRSAQNIDQATRALWRDVWMASGIDLREPSKLALTTPTDVIEWTAGVDTLSRRQRSRRAAGDLAPVERAYHIGSAVRFEERAGHLVLVADESLMPLPNLARAGGGR